MKSLRKVLLFIFLILLILAMTGAIIFGIMPYSSASKSGEKFLSTGMLRERNGDILGYRLKENGKILWKIYEHDSNADDMPPSENQPPIYCLRAGLGFNEHDKVYTYDISFDMLTEKEEIAAQNNVLYNLVNSGKYNKLLALLSYIYAPGGSSSEYREKLLEEVNKKYPNEYTHPLKDIDIEVANQLVIWSLVNSENEFYRENYNKTDLLEYTTDASSYYDLTKYGLETQEGEERERQIESLYKYLADASEKYFLGGEIVNQKCEVSDEEGCDVKKEPGSSSETIVKLPNGTSITTIRDNVGFIEGKTWSLVELEDGTQGYVNSNSYKIVEYNETCEVTTRLGIYIRDIPSTSGNIIGEADNGEMVTRIERNSATANGFVWDKVKIADGTIGYAASKYLTLVPNELYEENFQGVGEPAKIDSEKPLEYTIENGNYIVGPINVVKNNDLLYDVDFSVKIGEENVDNYTILNSEKLEVQKEDVKEGEFYLSIPITKIDKITVDASINYEATKPTLWARTENDLAQPVVIIDKEKKKDTTSLEVTPEEDSEILKQTIAKTGRESINSREDKVDYKINYEAEISKYAGTAKIKLVDNLQYPINDKESVLDDGIYNSEDNTITWDIDIENINTFKEENEISTISVEKNISLLYEGVDALKENITNTVKGQLLLENDVSTEEITETYDTTINIEGKVSVEYKDRYSDALIETTEEHTGKVGTEFNVETDEKQIPGYTLVEGPTEKTGEYTEDPQVKTYYYAKNTEVIVKYLEKDDTPEDYTDNLILAEQKTIPGYEGLDYTATQEEIENYIFVEDTENTTGAMTKDPIVVIYYYLQKTKVVVNYIDKLTEQNLDTYEKEGLVGETFTSEARDFEEYVLVQKPSKETVTMEKNVITLNYYYIHVSSGVIEKHIDVKTEKLLDNKEYEGKVGDEYNTAPQSFEGYDLVEEMYPDNAKGKMTEDVIEVKYYYIKRASVKVEHIDKITRETIQEKDAETKELKDSTEYIYGHEDDPYETKEKTFENYDLVQELYPENAKGEMTVTKNEYGSTNSETVVKYYYVKKSEGVVERHKDLENDNLLEDETTYTGHEGDPYATNSKEFKYYRLATNEEYYTKYVQDHPEVLTENNVQTVKELLAVLGKKANDNYIPENKSGLMTTDQIVVEYYYTNIKTEVVVKYLEKSTEKELAKDKHIDGSVGDSYETEEKYIEGYKLDKTTYPKNNKGTMTKEPIEVKYYYEKQENINNSDNQNQVPSENTNNNNNQTQTPSENANNNNQTPAPSDNTNNNNNNQTPTPSGNANNNQTSTSSENANNNKTTVTAETTNNTPTTIQASTSSTPKTDTSSENTTKNGVEVPGTGDRIVLTISVLLFVLIMNAIQIINSKLKKQ